MLELLKQALEVAARYLGLLKSSQNEDLVKTVQEPTPPISVAPKPSQPQSGHPMATLNNICLAIRDFEGHRGDRNYRNNNPGNCRYSSVGYAAIYGVVRRDPQNFAIFKDYETGWLYLKNLVKGKIKAHPEWTLVDFFKNYAPPTDGNNPNAYATYVANRLEVDDDTFRIKNITL